MQERVGVPDVAEPALQPCNAHSTLLAPVGGNEPWRARLGGIIVVVGDPRSENGGVGAEPREALVERCDAVAAGVEHAVLAVGVVVAVAEGAVGVCANPVRPLPGVRLARNSEDGLAAVDGV